jgi:hypothetical protein
MILSLVMMSIFGSMFVQTNPLKGPSPEPKAEATATLPAATDYDIRWGVKLPLRDKVELNATLYFPKTPDGPRRRMKGGRLGLVVYSPNSIFWQKNYNLGGVVADETAKDAHTAHIKMYHDTQRPSSIDLPLR